MEAEPKGDSVDHQSEEISIADVLTEVLAFVKKRGYVPGERLPSERDLALRFKVGRGLVREALTTLETLRYLNRKPNSGVFLHKSPTDSSVELFVLYSQLGIPIETDDIKYSLEVQKLLTVQAVELACLHRTQQDIDTLNRLASESQILVDREQSIAKVDEEFHVAIFEAAHNPVLTRLMYPFFVLSRNSRHIIFEDRVSRLIAQARNAKLAAAIAARDVAASTSLVAKETERVEIVPHPG